MGELALSLFVTSPMMLLTAVVVVIVDVLVVGVAVVVVHVGVVVIDGVAVVILLSLFRLHLSVCDILLYRPCWYCCRPLLTALVAFPCFGLLCFHNASKLLCDLIMADVHRSRDKIVRMKKEPN